MYVCMYVFVSWWLSQVHILFIDEWTYDILC